MPGRHVFVPLTHPERTLSALVRVGGEGHDRRMGSGAEGDGTLDQVVELRVHGVSGTKPESVLGDPYPTQVAGDEAARIFRRTTPVVEATYGRSRIVEAFHWGRLTSGSATRALWLLLVPFALLNLARFTMLLPHQQSDVRRRDQAATAVLRLLGLGLTLLLVATACFVGWTIGAPRFDWYPEGGGYFVLLGAIPAAVIVTLVWWFGRQVFTHDPAGGMVPWRTPYGSFDDVGFWSGSPNASRLRAAHVVASLGLFGLLALATVAPFDADAAVAAPIAWSVLVAVNAVVVLYGVWLVALEPSRSRRVESSSLDTVRLSDRVARARIAAVPVTAASVFLAAWAQDHGAGSPLGDAVAADAPAGPPEITISWLAVIVSLLLVALAITTWQQRQGPVADRLLKGDATDPSYPLVPPAFRPFWRGWGPWLLTVVAVALAFGLSTVLVFWTSSVIGNGRLPTIFGFSAAIWGGAALLLAASIVPLAGAALERPLAKWPWFVAIGAAAVLFVQDRRTTVDLRDLWYLVPLALVGLSLRLLLGQDADGPYTALLAEDYPPDPVAGGGADDLQRGRRAVLTRWFIAESRTRYHRVIGFLAAVSGLALVLASIASLGNLRPTVLGGTVSSGVTAVTSSALFTFGVAVVSAVAAALIGLGLTTLRDPEKRRTVGIIWDVLSFWPRDAHPLCPPPYGGRAVLGVATRAVQLAEPRDVGGLGARAVVVSGHSQGSLISVGAIAVLDYLGWPSADPPVSRTEAAAADDGPVAAAAPVFDSPGLPWLHPARARSVLPRLSLVTYGSQLQFLYGRMFPTYFGYGRMSWLYLQALRRTSGSEPLPPTAESRWRNVYRWTDPLGAPALSWPAGVDRPGPQTTEWLGFAWAADDPTRPRTAEPRVTTVRGVPHRWYKIGSDLRLVDPAVVAESALEPRLPPLGHSDYPLDPVFDVVVADLAEPRGTQTTSTPMPPTPTPEAPDLPVTPSTPPGAEGATPSGAEPPEAEAPTSSGAEPPEAEAPPGAEPPATPPESWSDAT